jgi:hypothetical protein
MWFPEFCVQRVRLREDVENYTQDPAIFRSVIMDRTDTLGFHRSQKPPL